MITLEFNKDGELVQVHSSFSHSRSEMERVWAAENTLVNRNDIRSPQQADLLASQATEFTEQLHIAIDRGAHVSPRFDVIRCPAVGDKVSYSFNGDSYPDGEITKVSPTLKVITTSTGSRHLGAVGGRLRGLRLRCESARGMDSHWGTTILYKFHDPDGNVLSWFSSGGAELEPGAEYLLDATVKGRGEFRGVAETQLTRARVHEEVQA